MTVAGAGARRNGDPLNARASEELYSSALESVHATPVTKKGGVTTVSMGAMINHQKQPSKDVNNAYDDKPDGY